MLNHFASKLIHSADENLPILATKTIIWPYYALMFTNCRRCLLFYEWVFEKKREEVSEFDDFETIFQ